MVTLQPPDSHHLLAAVGWLELGNPSEALLELARLSPDNRIHPDALEVAWTIHSNMRDWDRCVEVARELTTVAPELSFGWIHLSYALHELKRTREAYDNLIPVLERFPGDWLMSYNLACYACQMGELKEASRWLAGAMVKGDRKEVTQMAQEDPDLAPLFKEEK
ncbi:MAG: tetratricopeptide repeat protein [Verrucomicrobia bacterium]|nr:tetratricopeptide repeat protein [Verrucomicrobiota bacterium]